MGLLNQMRAAVQGCTEPTTGCHRGLIAPALRCSQIAFNDRRLANDTLNLTGHGEPLQVAIARVSPNFFSVLRVEPQLGRAFAEDEGRPEGKFVAMLLGIFSATALVLAVTGIYGVLAYSAAQRRHEFGIRLALGASRSNLLRLVMQQGLILAAGGIVIGFAAALLLTRLMSSLLLYGVGVRDLTTFAVAPLLFLAIALLASYVPARGATEVDPIAALRQQ